MARRAIATAIGRTYAGSMALSRAWITAALVVASLALAACGGGGHKSTNSFKVGTDTGPAESSGSNEAGVGAQSTSDRTTFLLSTAQGGFPNGPSRNAAVSHDQRVARYIAYESDASNIVDGDTNNQTDVFLVFRAPPFGHNGTPWKAAGTQLISNGLGGAPANGPSYRPALDGDSHHAPHCVAFVSEASNLVTGDSNGKADGFVYDTGSRKITRVSVASGGKQMNGSTSDISISGDCERVAFTSDAGGRQQVYVHVLRGSGLDAGFKGKTFVASATAAGRPGNGNSSEGQIARSGKSVVFTSTATNLAKGDKTSTPDVYRRTILRKFRHLANGKGAQTLQGDTQLVSATAAGKAGNGASSHPTITDDGRYVAFQTDASNLLPGDSNGATDVVRADMRTGRPRQEWVSKTKFGIGNGASRDPVISDAGEFILFDSEATNLRPSESVKPDPNGVKDVFLWNAPTRNVSLESRDADNGYLDSPSQHPATSSRGNYVPFESADPLIDLPLAQQLFPKLVQSPQTLNLASLPALTSPDIPAPQLAKLARAAGFQPVTAGASLDEVAKAAAAAGQQIYLRYLGAK
jgi:hypothetical protein